MWPATTWWRMDSSKNRVAEKASGSDIIGATGALFGALVTVAGVYATFRPNRILLGEPQAALGALGPVGWALLGAWVLVFALSVIPGGRRLALARGVTANAIAVGSVYAVARLAADYLLREGSVVRLSVGLSFWLGLLACYIVGFAAMGWLRGRFERFAVGWSGALAIVGLAVSGRLDALGIMQEYLRNPEVFWQAFRQQIAYTIGATGVALVIGLTFGILAARRPRTEGAVFGLINVLQVLPTLSFIGLLIVPMGWLGNNVALLDALGVSGIGWAPVFVVLVAYAIYPITRNTYSAMKTLDAGVIDAARGVGMKPAQRLAWIEMPLAFPVVLAGVRIAAVQTASAAIIAGLVGGGGLGQIVFYGLQQTATDLMLLGVIPIVALAMTLDASLRAVQGAVSGVEPRELVAA